MITYDQAVKLSPGEIIHHITQKNSDKTPLRARVTGQIKIWKTRPGEFRLPVKYGLYTSFYINDTNANNWEIPQN